MRKAIHIFGTIVTALTVLVILAASVFYIPRLAGIQPYIVLSGSMEPAIPTGAVAFIDTKDTSVSVGDIVTYRLPSMNDGETLVTHRIIREENGDWITKGDANDVEDLTLVSGEQIVGSFRFSIPVVGYVIAQLTRKTIVVAVVWIFLLNGISLVLSAVVDREHTEEEPAGETDRQTRQAASPKEGIK